MTYPKIGDSVVWIYANGDEIGSLKLNAAGAVVDRYPHDNDLVGLVRSIYEQARAR